MSHELRMSKTTEWITPKWIFDWLGCFDLDPATIDDHPFPHAKYNRSADGLGEPWHGRVFLNPPFTSGQIEPFVKRMCEHQNGVMVVAARVETKWFQDYVFAESQAIFFPKGRIQYCDRYGSVIKRCAFPSCIVFYGESGTPSPIAGAWWKP